MIVPVSTSQSFTAGMVGSLGGTHHPVRLPQGSSAPEPTGDAASAANRCTKARARMPARSRSIATSALSRNSGRSEPRTGPVMPGSASAASRLATVSFGYPRGRVTLAPDTTSLRLRNSSSLAPTQSARGEQQQDRVIAIQAEWPALPPIAGGRM
jgi:hypothetical protein